MRAIRITIADLCAAIRAMPKPAGTPTTIASPVAQPVTIRLLRK
jgi:hypothetical protein